MPTRVADGLIKPMETAALASAIFLLCRCVHRVVEHRLRSTRGTDNLLRSQSLFLLEQKCKREDLK